MRVEHAVREAAMAVAGKGTHALPLAGAVRLTGIGLTRMEMIEMPEPYRAPSNYDPVDRSILQPEIFERPAKQTGDANNAIRLTEGMKRLAQVQPFHAQKFAGRAFDCCSGKSITAANGRSALWPADGDEDGLALHKDMAAHHDARTMAA